MTNVTLRDARNTQPINICGMFRIRRNKAPNLDEEAGTQNQYIFMQLKK